MGAFSIPPRPLTANDAGFIGPNNMPHRTPVGCMGDRRAHSARGTRSRRRPVHMSAVAPALRRDGPGPGPDPDPGRAAC